jgi:hypothetical protein
MKTFKYIVLLTLLTAAASSTMVGCKSHEPVQSASNDAYPLTKCVVSGDDLGDKPYVFTHHGQTVKLCCKDCLAKFNAEPDTYMAKLNQAK